MARTKKPPREILVTNIAGLQEIAKKFGVSTTTAWNWTHRDKTFPKPVAQVSGKPVWDMTDIIEWRPLPTPARKRAPARA